MIELGALDAQIARAAKRGDAALADDSREVAGKSTYDEVAAYEANVIEADHRAALLRWIHSFVERRIDLKLTEEEKKRADAEDPELADARGPITFAKTWNEARTALLGAPNLTELGKAVTRLAELADPIAAVRRERKGQGFEVARRLNAARVPLDVAPLANAFLDASEPLTRDLLKRGTPAEVIESSFAKDAQEGWPARLTSRWLEDAFKTIAPRTPKDVRMPTAIGGASFLRAAHDWGHALRLGSTAKSLPFALSRDPAPTEAFAYGSLIARAVADRPFARRKLGLPARIAHAHARALARTRLLALRREAALALLERAESPPVDEVEHFSERVFSQPLPATLAVAWSIGGFSGASRTDAHARFAGALKAHALYTDLVQQHDEDWFDNPRAAHRLANVASSPVWNADLPDVTTALSASFESELG
jgi:hypothetical protein